MRDDDRGNFLYGLTTDLEEMVEQSTEEDTLVAWFPAKFNGNCKACRMEIRIGHMIGYVGGEIVGRDCCGGFGGPVTDVRSVLPHGKTAKDYCPDCFMIHATLQTECE